MQSPAISAAAPMATGPLPQAPQSSAENEAYLSKLAEYHPEYRDETGMSQIEALDAFIKKNPGNSTAHAMLANAMPYSSPVSTKVDLCLKALQLDDANVLALKLILQYLAKDPAMKIKMPHFDKENPIFAQQYDIALEIVYIQQGKVASRKYSKAAAGIVNSAAKAKAEANANANANAKKHTQDHNHKTGKHPTVSASSSSLIFTIFVKWIK